ncbi:hypothetical protein C0Q70_20170 [Pomacea canaliculata]|uniref:Ig-like domain-containing protein n=2 Tax=Pomacea canaliculata TaxID=400727 RepID=A0A2T7NEU4_POMCA|nr:hypothetical protein C0Q70_20170 [Pomacea canaliculata]
MVDPPYNPFWVLEGTTFRASCSAEVRDLEWFIDGSSPKVSGYEEWRNSTTDGVRTTVTISKSKMGWDVSPNIICRSPSAGKDVVVGVNIFAAYIRNANISEGNDVSVECRPDSSPEVSTVSWSRDGAPLSNDSGRVILLENNTKLVILRSTPADAGVYTCNMTLQAGPKINQTFTQPVTLAGKPYLFEKMSSHVQVYLNDSLYLTCPVKGYPSPEVYWLHNGDTPVSPSTRVTMSTYEDVAGARLSVRNLTTADMGLYRCAAENGLGRVVKTFHVGVTGGALTCTGHVISLVLAAGVVTWVMRVE